MHADFPSDLSVIMLLRWKRISDSDSGTKKAYLIEKNMPAEKHHASSETGRRRPEKRRSGTIAVMKKNKKFQKEQLTEEGYEEFVEFFQ